MQTAFWFQEADASSFTSVLSEHLKRPTREYSSEPINERAFQEGNYVL